MCQLKTAKYAPTQGVSALEPSWELVTADAEERIVKPRRSIEVFKHNQGAGIPFPSPATHNQPTTNRRRDLRESHSNVIKSLVYRG
jgi:hypothetical protein